MLLSFATEAQNLKIGYINAEKVLSEWPKAQSAQTELSEYETELQTRLQAKVKDFQTKVADYNAKIETMDDLTKKEKETELQNLQTQIQQFEADASESISKKNRTLFEPLQVELKQTIDAVSKENGFTHVFNQNAALVFTSDTAGDISDLVAQKLGYTLSTSSN